MFPTPSRFPASYNHYQQAIITSKQLLPASNRGQQSLLPAIVWSAMDSRSVTPITVAEVEDAVRRYWNVAASKLTVELQSFYLDTASIFATASKRLEPARLVTARRTREYMNSNSR